MSGMSRKEFLQKGIYGFLASFFAVAALADSVKAAPKVTTNQTGGPCVVGNTAPTNVSQLWVDTSSYTPGVLKYYNGSSWVAVTSVWS